MAAGMEKLTALKVAPLNKPGRYADVHSAIKFFLIVDLKEKCHLRVNANQLSPDWHFL